MIGVSGALMFVCLSFMVRPEFPRLSRLFMDLACFCLGYAAAAP